MGFRARHLVRYHAPDANLLLAARVGRRTVGGCLRFQRAAAGGTVAEHAPGHIHGGADESRREEGGVPQQQYAPLYSPGKPVVRPF